MKKEINELYEILKKDRKHSSYSNQDTLLNRSKELKSEVIEIIEAIKNDDINNLKEELGDALLDLMFISIIAEEKNFFSFEETINSALSKIKRRKPWIFNNEKLSIEEEKKRWNEIKMKEH